MRKHHRLLIAFSLLLASSACDSFDSTSSPSPSDAGADGTAGPDGTVTPTDAGVDADAAGGGGCAHQFCQDFDHGEPSAPWIKTAGVTLQSTIAVSKPSSAEIVMSEPTNNEIVVKLVVPSPAKHIACGAQVQIDQRNAKRSPSVLRFYGPKDEYIGYELEPGDNGAAKVTTTKEATDFSTPDLTTFKPIALDIEILGTGKATVLVKVGDLVTDTLIMNTAITVIDSVAFGLSPNDATDGTWKAHLDDLWCDVISP